MGQNNYPKMKYQEFNQEDELLLRQFIRGSLLGDGSIPKLGKLGANCYMKFGHSNKQLFYLKYKQKFLKSFNLDNTIIEYNHISDRYITGNCFTYHMKSKTHPIFSLYRNLYYESKKIVSQEIEQMDAFALAIWFMDDAHLWKKKDRTPVYVFNTQGFNQYYKELLQSTLLNNFNIECTILKNQGELLIRVRSMENICNIISTYVFDEFKYKLNWKLGSV